MTSRKKYLAKNTIIFGISTIGTRLLTFFLVPLYSRSLTTAEYGDVDLIVTIGMIIVPIITLNIGQAVMRFSLDEDADIVKVESVGLSFLFFSFMLGTITFAVLRFFPKVNVDPSLVYWYCVTQGLFQTASFFVRGREELRKFGVANILHSALILIFTVVFLFVYKWGVRGYFYSYILSNILSALYCACVIDVFSSIKAYKFDFDLMKKMSRYSLLLVPESLVWWIINSSDHIMVISMIGNAANGIYAMAYKIPSILSLFSNSFTQAWAFTAIHEESSKDRDEFSNNMFRRFLGAQEIITSLLLLFIRPIMSIYVSSSYYDAWKYTPYLLVGFFFLSASNFLATIYTVKKDSKGFLYSGTIGAILNLCLNWILIPIFGIHGAAFATCLSYCVVFLYRAKDTRKYMVIHVFKKEYIVGYLLIISMALSMALPLRIGYVILSLGVIALLIINKELILEFLTIIRSLIIRKQESSR